MTLNLDNLCISTESLVRDAASSIDRNAKGIVLVTDSVGRLRGTITDGDIRRWMLAGFDLGEPLAKMLQRKARSNYALPVTAPREATRDEQLQIMREKSVRHLPLLNSDGTVAGLVTLDDLVPEQLAPLQAVIMAGGFGRRMKPLTDDLPKPMLPVGGLPLMQRTIEQLRKAGVRRVNVTTHYLPEKIYEYFGDGARFGVDLTYVSEDRPLGTAGFLALMAAPSEPLLVINGDILTQIDYRAMLQFHQEQKADLTLAGRRYEIGVPYGVIEAEGPEVRAVVEKPNLGFLVNAGIYVLEPSVHRFVPADKHFDMTDLIRILLQASRNVSCFPLREYWLDIGRPGDYEQAQLDVKQWRAAS